MFHVFFYFKKQLKHDTVSKRLPEWNMPNLCQKEQNFPSMVLFSPRIMDFLNQHITRPIIGLTSQQIIQLDQLCYPFDTQLFKHPWTDERSCKTAKVLQKNIQHTCDREASWNF